MRDAEKFLADLKDEFNELVPGVEPEQVDRVMDFLMAGWLGDEQQIKATHAQLPGALQLKAAFLLRGLRDKVDRVIRVTSSPAAVASTAKSKVSRFVRR